MKTLLVVVAIFAISSKSHAEDTKCVKQVDQELKSLNMGSFDHPSSCSGKDSANINNEKTIEFHLGPKFMPGLAGGFGTSLSYNPSSIFNKDGPIVRISQPDLMGSIQSKDIYYDQDCKVKKVSFRTGMTTTAELDKATCQKLNDKLDLAFKNHKPVPSLDSPEMQKINNCKLYDFSNNQQTGYVAPTKSEDANIAK